jgi:hypothetical protein
VVAVLKANVRARMTKLWARWRDNIGEGAVSRAAHRATLREHAAQVSELEVKRPQQERERERGGGGGRRETR